MKAGLVLVVLLLVLTPSVAAQSVCRQALSQFVKREPNLTVYSVSLPSLNGQVKATAVIPNTPLASRPADAVVFEFSKLVSSDPKQSIDILPIAMVLAQNGRPSIIVARTLTWPEIDKSVGTMETQVICAQQWLSRHAATRDEWKFVGPVADSPSPENFSALGDASMRGWLTYPIGGDGENMDTQNMMGSKGQAELIKDFLSLFVDEYDGPAVKRDG